MGVSQCWVSKAKMGKGDMFVKGLPEVGSEIKDQVPEWFMVIKHNGNRNIEIRSF